MLETKLMFEERRRFKRFDLKEGLWYLTAN